VFLRWQDFYTPITSRSVAFVYQTPQDIMSRSASDAGALHHASGAKHARHASHQLATQRHVTSNARSVQYGQQLSLFIVFEKKAGLIRLADSAVDEVEMFDDATSATYSLGESSSSATLSSPSRHNHSRRSRGSGDGSIPFARDTKAHWILPTTAEVPLVPSGQVTQAVYCLTRGKKTHILTNPLPTAIASTPPLKAHTWASPPTAVSCRLLRPDDRGGAPWLQLVAASEDGVEVLEFPAGALLDRKEKGRADTALRAQTAFGGDAGLLCAGGHWDRPYDAPLARTYSTSSVSSYSSMDTEELVSRLRADQGLYGWQRRGLEDWRIFWAGGTGRDVQTG
jgi:hypothetical protein